MVSRSLWGLVSGYSRDGLLSSPSALFVEQSSEPGRSCDTTPGPSWERKGLQALKELTLGGCWVSGADLSLLGPLPAQSILGAPVWGCWGLPGGKPEGRVGQSHWKGNFRREKSCCSVGEPGGPSVQWNKPGCACMQCEVPGVVTCRDRK